jgi:hypothetical protein
MSFDTNERRILPDTHPWRNPDIARNTTCELANPPEGRNNTHPPLKQVFSSRGAFSGALVVVPP